MRRLIDEALSGLPFEVDWLRAHHIPARFIGHPYFDQLHRQQAAARFPRHPDVPGWDDHWPLAWLAPSGSRAQYRSAPPRRWADSRADRKRDFLWPVSKRSIAKLSRLRSRTWACPLRPMSAGPPRSSASALVLVRIGLSESGTPFSRDPVRDDLSPALAERRNRQAPFIKSPFISLVNLLCARALFPEYFSSRRDQSDFMAAEIHRLAWESPKSTRFSERAIRAAKPGRDSGPASGRHNE